MTQPLPGNERPFSSRSRPAIARSHRQLKLSPSPGRVKLLVQTSSRNRALAGLGVFFGVIGAASVTIAGIWLSVALIVNPDEPLWLETFLPRPGLGLAQAMPQTLAQIKADINQAGLTLGEAALLRSALNPTAAPTDWLIPILATRPHCQTHCAQIVELRVYRPQPVTETGQFLTLVDHLSTAGLEEAFVVAPFVGTAFESPGSTRKLPLTQLKSLPNEMDSDVWFTLQGEWGRGKTQVLYGQLIRYDPRQGRLSPLLAWTSPAGKQPHWQDLDNSQPAELMVDHTVGLQPQFQAYRLERTSSPVRPLRLRPISFLEPALNQSWVQSAYGNALLLARHQLWSAALRSLHPLKQQSGQNWTAAAEAQLQLIQHHAEITKVQAARTWASPSQQISAYLADGQWNRALELFESEPDAHTSVYNLLKADADRLWNRVITVLRINPNQPAAQAWGALILTAQHNPSTALNWLARQPNSTVIAPRLRSLITPPVALAPVYAYPPVSPAAAKQIIGSAIRLESIDPTAWLSPHSRQLLRSPEQTFPDQATPEIWYRIQVTAIHDGQQWRHPPFSYISRPEQSDPMLWRQLGLDSDLTLELLAQFEAGWNQFGQVKVKALQIQADSLWLLASGKSALELGQADLPLLAATPQTLGRPTPTSAIPLAQLNQQHPDWATQITSTVQQMALGEDGGGVLVNSEPAARTTAPGIATSLSRLPVQLIDLTGEGRPEALITLTPAEEAGILGTRSDVPDNDFPRTLIFSATGGLIYSDFASRRTLVALALSSPGTPTALVIQADNRLQLWEWSKTVQRFHP